MSSGGIFTGPTALGIPERGVFQNAALSGVPIASCVFASNYPTDAARAVQGAMNVLGASLIKADGLWGPCSESAFRKIAGAPLSKDAIEKKFGITCGSFQKLGIFDPAKCTSGKDAVTPVVTPATPPVTGQPPGFIPVTAKKRVPSFTLQTELEQPPSPPAPKDTTTPPVAPPVGTKTWISGVPNWAVIAGGAVLVVGGIGGYLMLKKPRATPNRRRRRRHH